MVRSRMMLLLAALAATAAVSLVSAGGVPVYTVTSVVPQSIGFTAQLALANPGAGTYGPAVPSLQLVAVYESAERVHFTLTDASNARYTIPTSVLPFPLPGSRDFPTPGASGSYNTSHPSFVVPLPVVGQPLLLSVKRTVDGAVIFDLGELEYSDQFLQLTALFPPDALGDDGQPQIYGLGEHVIEWQLPSDNHTFTLYNIDQSAPYDSNEYGSHPFYLQTLGGGSGLAHGVFLRNSNGMDVLVSSSSVQFRAIGGILDFYVFIGPTPELVTQQYHAVIGRPALPTYWALGWHQCRWGVPDLAELEGVVAAYAKHSLPLDTIWSDIDYMSGLEDFSWDPVRYPLEQVQAFVAHLHEQGQHYVAIIDPGLHNRTGYAPYDSGLSQGVFVRTGDGVTPFVGTVFPGSTVFPDFLHPNATAYWKGLVADFLHAVPYDGLWIDMNEVANAYQDSPLPYNSSSPVNNPPYAINNLSKRAPLNMRTIPSDALHAEGTQLEYNVHNLYGLTEGMATRVALEASTGKRAFLLCRSTFAGSGKYVAHWLGDNHATWDDMRHSISGVLSMNLLGVTMVGADICGFNGNATEELCARWHAMGAFYPFARNHHNGHTYYSHQEPYMWASVASVARRSLTLRYTLLPTLYTAFHAAHVSGGTVARSLMFNFPADAQARAIGEQWMWGSALLITPVLSEGAVSVKGYFPTAARWYDAWSWRELVRRGGDDDGWLELPCPLSDGVLVHYAGGSILPSQPTPGGALTTAQARNTPFQLLVALDDSEAAAGQLFWDADGQQLDPLCDSIELAFAAQPASRQQQQQPSVNWSVTRNSLASSSSLPLLDSVVVLGVRLAVVAVQLNGSPLSASSFQYVADKHVLLVQGLATKLTSSGAIQWTYAAADAPLEQKKHYTPPRSQQAIALQ